MASFYESFSLEALFTALTVFALAAAIILALLVKPIGRMISADAVPSAAGHR